MRPNRRKTDAGSLIVAIDGPVASGKSSVGKAAAEALGLRFLDTGVMYRAVTWLALHRDVPVTDFLAIGSLAEGCQIDVAGDSPGTAGVSIDGHQLGDALVSDAVNRNVSAVSAVSAVRTALVRRQRAIAVDGGIVMVGRDIGSVVLPCATVKLYIDASAEERARRRFEQMRESSVSTNYEQILHNTLRRDELDRGRADSPLMVADGATVIKTDGIGLEEAIAAVVAAINAGKNVNPPGRALRK